MINKHRAPVAQLDRTLGYGTKGSASRTFRDCRVIPTLLAYIRFAKINFFIEGYSRVHGIRATHAQPIVFDVNT